MILQFSNVEYLDPDVAKFYAWITSIGNDVISTDIAELSDKCGVKQDVIINNDKIQELLRLKNNPQSSKTFRTPLSDWRQIPFFIDDDERPISATNAWLRHVSKRGSPKTWRTYAYDLYDFFQYLEWKKVVWQKVDDNILVSYRLRQETTDSNHKKKHKGDRRVSRNTIQARLLTVGRFYKYAAQYGFLKSNPLTYEIVKTRRPDDAVFLAHVNTTREREIPVAAYDRVAVRNVTKWLPHETVWRWINSIDNKRDKLIAKLLYQTGMRREEIILWEVGDIPDVRTLTNAESSDRVKLSIRGKGGKGRTIRISAKTFLTLRRWIDVDREKILKKCGLNRTDDHGFVWISVRDGHPLQAITLNHIFERISTACGITITPHMLRHSFAMERRADLYESKIPNPEKVLQEALGHSSVVTTITAYGHISPEWETKEADSNADLLKKLSFEDKDDGEDT
jgi:site-specific recombinase XerD